MTARITHTAALAVALTALSACTNDESAEMESGGGGSGAQGAGGGGSSGEGGAGAAPTYRGHVEGIAVDEDGVPLAALSVTLCAEVCLITDTDADGVFRFDEVRPASQVLKNLSLPGPDPAAAALSHTHFFDFVDVGEDEQIVLDHPFVVHRVPSADGPRSGPQTVEADGLSIAFDAALFGTEQNPLPDPAKELFFGVVALPPEDWPTGGLLNWTVLGAWGAAVWDLESEDAFAVTASLGDAGPLAAGTPVAFLVADYTYGFLNGHFVEEEAELAADGMSIRTPVDGGLDRATLWLAVARLPP